METTNNLKTLKDLKFQPQLSSFAQNIKGYGECKSDLKQEAIEYIKQMNNSKYKISGKTPIMFKKKMVNDQIDWGINLFKYFFNIKEEDLK